MSETTLSGAFSENGRVNVKEYFFKVLRYVGLFAALTIITGVCFYLLKPYYEFWNRKGAVAQSLCVAVFIILAIAGIYCKKTGKMTPDLLLKLILVAGYVVRLTYMLYTPVAVRQYDTYNRALTGHEAYAWIIYSTGKLPTTNDYQFYHPPLNAFVQATFMRVTNGLTEILQKVFGLGDAIPSEYLSGMPTVTSSAYVGLTEYRYYLYSTTQILAVIWSVVTMFSLVKILKLLGLKGYALAAVSAFAVFFPRHIEFAGQVNNDALAYMFQMLSVYYCLRWWKRGRRLYDLLICAVCIGLGMMAKISAAVICIPIGCVFAYEFFREIGKVVSEQKNGVSGAWKKVAYMAACYVLFLCICAPIGLWFQVYAYKTFGQEFGFVFSNLNGALSTTHHNWFERLFITLDPNEYFGTLYCIPFCTIKDGVTTAYNNYNLPLYQLRSALFGEFNNYKGGECFSATAFACGVRLRIVVADRVRRNARLLRRSLFKKRQKGFRGRNGKERYRVYRDNDRFVSYFRNVFLYKNALRLHDGFQICHARDSGLRDDFLLYEEANSCREHGIREHARFRFNILRCGDDFVNDVVLSRLQRVNKAAGFSSQRGELWKKT